MWVPVSRSPLTGLSLSCAAPDEPEADGRLRSEGRGVQVRDACKGGEA